MSYRWNSPNGIKSIIHASIGYLWHIFFPLNTSKCQRTLPQYSFFYVKYCSSSQAHKKTKNKHWALYNAWIVIWNYYSFTSLNIIIYPLMYKMLSTDIIIWSLNCLYSYIIIIYIVSIYNYVILFCVLRFSRFIDIQHMTTNWATVLWKFRKLLNLFYSNQISHWMIMIQKEIL